MRYLFGNWKMNLSRSEAVTLAKSIAASGLSPLVLRGVCPPMVWLDAVTSVLDGTAVEVAAQQCHGEHHGQFTGETSAVMLAEMGIRWTLIGHSERRRTFHESESECAARCAGAFKAGLRPIICVGESAAEQDCGSTAAVVLEQLRPCLEVLGTSTNALIAYEPVWAIGSGRIPSTEQISTIMTTIRAEVGERIPVLYGGSVTPDNSRALAAIPGVSGFLVGGASLDGDKFLRIGAALA